MLTWSIPVAMACVSLGLVCGFLLVQAGATRWLVVAALKEACGLTKPRKDSQADIEGIFRRAMTA